MKLAFRISAISASVLLQNRMRTLKSNHPNFSAVVDHLNSGGRDEDYLASLIDIPAFLARETHGLVTVSDNSVRYNGEAIHNHLAARILTHLREGISIQPLALFLDRLMKNPNEEIRSDAFAWLEAGDMPITEDGFVIAFKKVQGDYYSEHAGKDGKVLHAIGTTVSMDRADCDEDRDVTCSTGLHFCSYGYLNGYSGSNGRIVIVKVSPEDITAIPNEYNLQKGRCCSYNVVGEIDYEEAQEFFTGQHVTSPSAGFDTDDEDMSWTGEDICDDCGNDLDDCGCDDLNCDDCGNDLNYCVCDDDDDWDDEDDEAEPMLKNYSLSYLRAFVKSAGQRGVCRLLDIPRSSLYDFLKLHADTMARSISVDANGKFF